MSLGHGAVSELALGEDDGSSGSGAITGTSVVSGFGAVQAVGKKSVSGSASVSGFGSVIATGPVPVTVPILIRCPYLTTDTIGVKTVQLYEIIAGVLTAIGSPITTGFSAIPNITNGWQVLVDVEPNEAFGDVAAIAVFSNINTTESAATEANRPPTSVPTDLVQCAVSKFLSTDTIGTPGYQIYDEDGAAIGSHVTAGILAIPGVTNGYVALVSLPPDVSNNYQFQGRIVWDG